VSDYVAVFFNVVAASCEFTALDRRNRYRWERHVGALAPVSDGPSTETDRRRAGPRPVALAPVSGGPWTEADRRRAGSGPPSRVDGRKAAASGHHHRREEGWDTSTA